MPIQAVLVAFDQGLEGPLDLVADLHHEADVRVARLQLLLEGLDLSTHRGFLPDAGCL